MKKLLHPANRLVMFYSVSIGSCLILLASHTVADQKSRKKSVTPDVITTVTPNETQKNDAVRPEFLQPVPVE